MSQQVTTDQEPGIFLMSRDANISANVSFIPVQCTIFLSCLYSIIFVFSLPMNIVVLWAMWPQVITSLGVPVYAVSLLCAVLLEIITLPFGVAYMLGRLPLSSMSCLIISLIPTIAQRVAVTFVVWIFVVRYVAVVHPLGYGRLCKGWICSLTSISIWLLLICISLVQPMTSELKTEQCFPTYQVVTELALFDLITTFVFGLFPLVLLGTICILIFCALRNSPTVCIKQRRRINTLLLLVVFGFGFLCCPMNLVRAYQCILVLLGQPPNKVNNGFLLTYQLLFALSSLSVVLTPLFYAFSSSEVKKKLWELFAKNKPMDVPTNT
ncbi:CX3C chemokine receptor 1-like [Bombina bombina]|uniref:CX3C chemokine receptor 1-like n=1 Tax=Bombina bombina TaxID=8345 RepID=UPI00235AD3BA|nr:CX3C chemokine receptor 1-like [Bombina bombina]